MADSTFATMPLARTSGCAHPLETNFTPPIHVSWIPCVDCPGNHDYYLNLFAMISIACSTLQSYMTQSGKYFFVHAFAAKAPNACFDPTEHCHMHLPSLCTEKKPRGRQRGRPGRPMPPMPEELRPRAPRQLAQQTAQLPSHLPHHQLAPPRQVVLQAAQLALQGAQLAYRQWACPAPA